MSKENKKEYDLILVGPEMAGKTTFATVLDNGEPPKKYEQTRVIRKPKQYKIGPLFKKKYKIADFGGIDDDKIAKYFDNTELIVFVFNGVDFIKEIKDYKEGGHITSYFLHRVLNKCDEIDLEKCREKQPNKQCSDVGSENNAGKQQEKPKQNGKSESVQSENKDIIPLQNRISFVATHKDNSFPDDMIYQGDMKQAILDGMDRANREYREIAHCDRYPYRNLFISRLFTMNATNKDSVNEVFKELKKIIKEEL